MNAVRVWAICIAVVAAATTLLILGIRAGVAWDCRSYRAATGRESKMVGMYCFVKARDGEWYRIDERMLRNVTHGD